MEEVEGRTSSGRERERERERGAIRKAIARKAAGARVKVRVTDQRDGLPAAIVLAWRTWRTD